MFGGNPLAVVLDAAGLSTAQMQAIALEFNYGETTFVLPPRDLTHTAQVRIFTARAEVPFAGHPNVGRSSSATVERLWRIHQGVDMGRPSLLLGRTVSRQGDVVSVHIGGTCVAVMDGTFTLAGDDPSAATR